MAGRLPKEPKACAPVTLITGRPSVAGSPGTLLPGMPIWVARACPALASVELMSIRDQPKRALLMLAGEIRCVSLSTAWLEGSRESPEIVPPTAGAGRGP